MVTSAEWIEEQGDICICGHQMSAHAYSPGDGHCRMNCPCKFFRKAIMDLKIVLCATSPDLAAAWHKYHDDLPNVRVHEGSILTLTVDAVVSPANSFGYMDGGIDAAYTKHFGPEVQDSLQRIIQEYHDGELVVGNAEIVPTSNLRIPHLIAAPTMRVPMVLGSATVNPYLAARAVFQLIKRGKRRLGIYAGLPVKDAVKSVAFPGLGTGVGRVDPDICARQVRKAIDTMLLDTETFPGSWHDAQYRHQKMYTDKTRDLQRD